MEQKGLQAGLGIIQEGKCLLLKLTDVEKAIVTGVTTQILNRDTVVAKVVGIELPEDMQEFIEGKVEDIEPKQAN